MRKTKKNAVLVLNCGSSSIKYALFSGTKEAFRGSIDVGKRSYEELLKKIILELSHKGHITDEKEILAIGHRVVHGGDLTKSCIVTPSVLKVIARFCELAPMHNPHNLEGIRVAQKLFPHVPQIAVFDTAFHTTVSREKRAYAIPYQFTKKYGIQRYGFHGQSYQYIYRQLVELKKKKIVRSLQRVVVCHLGSGCSVCGILNGKSAFISSGMTTFSGMPMATRCGDIDVGIVPYLQKKMKCSLGTVMHLLHYASGFFGIAGTTDMKKIILGRKRNKRYQLAVDVFCYHLKQWIARCAGVLGGVDTLVFTGGIGENAAVIRALSLSGLEFLGVSLNQQKNTKNALLVSRNKSRVQVLVIQTDEERQIFEEVQRILNRE